jgi:amidase
VVGLRTTPGRIASYQASAPNRTISLQQMSVQGPLTRTVADARLALQVMAQGSALDPQWVPAPMEYEDSAHPVRVALFRRHPAYTADPGVFAALEQAAGWLSAAGYEVEEVVPPHFEEASTLWRQLVVEDMRRHQSVVDSHADAASKAALHGCMHGLPVWGLDEYLEGLVRRFNIARDWSVFLEKYPILMMPNSWEKQFPVDEDGRGVKRIEQILRAQSPLLCTAMLGLPGLSVPTGLRDGLPQGVQLVSARFREDRVLRAGEVIEQAARFNVLDYC